MLRIVSKDKDFSHALAEQARLCLGLHCETGETFGPAALTVTTGPKPEDDTPFLVLDPAQAPFRLREVLANIHAALQKSVPEMVNLSEELWFSPRKKQLTHASGASAELTDKETALVMALHEAGAAGATKEDLLKRVWGFEQALNTHTLETHVYRLRAKCKEVSGVEMIAGTDIGYRLTS